MSYQDHVIKRNGEKEVFSFDKILKRVTVLGNDKETGKIMQNRGNATRPKRSKEKGIRKWT